MRGKHAAAIVLALVAMTTSAFAITPGDDLLIAAAGRTGPWITDLYVMNPGSTTVSVRVYWLERGQSNPTPQYLSFNLTPNQMVVFDDILKEDFGFNRAGGAFRITVDGGVVTANALVYAVDGEETYGSGFEAIPVWDATAAGSSTTLMGLAADSGFRTNLFALAGASGADVTLKLLDGSGTVVAQTTLVLGAYEPYLENIRQLWSVQNIDNGSLLAEVTSGSAVFMASKIDELSEDPTTLEAAARGGGSIDGTYQFAIWDLDGFATGGNLVIADGTVESISGTYNNYFKVDGQGIPECTIIFQFGLGYNPTSVADFANGVDFTDSYTSTGDGDILWTITFEMDGAMGFSGTIVAEGSNFSGDASGCNGSFESLVLTGGKSE